jgi:hypothetical protein
VYKKCSKCGVEKSPSEFNKERGRLRAYCKSCHLVSAAKWAKENKDKKRAAQVRYRNRIRGYPKRPLLSEEEKISRRVSRNNEWRSKNLEKMRALRRVWAKANPVISLEATRAYQARKRNAMPEWANRFFIEEIYDLRARREKALGIPMDVDHIVPLNGDDVCGLYCEANLQIIPATQNRAKGNRWTMPKP